jgi:hypothetical protein
MQPSQADVNRLVSGLVMAAFGFLSLLGSWTLVRHRETAVRWQTKFWGRLLPLVSQTKAAFQSGILVWWCVVMLGITGGCTVLIGGWILISAAVASLR